MDETYIYFDNYTLLCYFYANLSYDSFTIVGVRPGIGEIRSLNDRLSANRIFGNKSKFSLIPLHSKLSSADQRKAFLPPKRGCRKIILR